MRRMTGVLLAALAAAATDLSGCGGGSSPLPPLVVNSPEDLAAPPAGTVTLRSALAAAAPNQPITFDPSLDGATIELTLVDQEHTVLKGEVMGMTPDPDTHVLVSYLVGYFERDFGASALYARKDVVIDATGLPNGVTLSCGPTVTARVLAVYGDLTMNRVTVIGGRSVAVPFDPPPAPATDPNAPVVPTATLARGGGLAVWGTARLSGCTLYGNACDKSADTGAARDRGAFGAGLYADAVELLDCVVAGNVLLGSGASGAGVFAVGGVEAPSRISSLEGCSVVGNRITAGTGYGAGVYSDGGGIGNAKTLLLRNCTVARNVIEPTVPVSTRGFWRGGGLYMSNGYMSLVGCTVVENQVTGYRRADNLGKVSLAGGVAATIGDAHAVESMVIGQCIVAGNTVTSVDAAGAVLGSYAEDVFTGSLLHFRSMGHNRMGVVNFDQILVPVGQAGWASLCRRHYPQPGDTQGAALADVVSPPAGEDLSPTLLSAGVLAGSPVPLRYRPTGSALDQVPASTAIRELLAEYTVASGGVDDFLWQLLLRIDAEYAPGFADAFRLDFEAFLRTADADATVPDRQPYLDPAGNAIETLGATRWFGPSETWTRMLYNYPYMFFWHRLDEALKARGLPALGQELLGDTAWARLFPDGPLPGTSLTMRVWWRSVGSVARLSDDQYGTARPQGALGDIGAVELP